MDTSSLQKIKQRYGIVGNAEGLNRALDIAVQVAPTDLPVLIEGESGVGKEVIPKIIHDNSSRKHSKYFAINCGAIPEGTIDSELFGHAKGAFTGAIGEREGYFGVANGGTLFLDEVGELPLATQARLLRVLETGEYIRVGENEVKRTNVRIVAATNVNMQKAIKEGKFREDLYYRLNAIPISLPPLRDRGNDIELLFRKFAYDISEKYHMDTIRLTPDAKALLLKYKWPGNIRQLRNLTEQLCVISEEREISADTLRLHGVTDDSGAGAGLVYRQGNGGEGEMHSYENDRKQILQLISSLGKELKDLKDYVYGAATFRHALPAIAEPIQHIDSDGTIQHINMAEYGKDEDDAPIQEYVEHEETPLSIKDMERNNIEKALSKHNGNRKSAAQELEISERTLYRKIKEFGIGMLLLLLVTAPTLTLLSSCSISYKFTGTSLNYDKVKTISVEKFPIRSAYVWAPMESMFYNTLVDEYSRKTKLKVLQRNGDLQLSGEIVEYSQTNKSVAADGYSAQTQLKVTVNVRFVNNSNHAEDFEQRFSATADYDSSQQLSAVQDDLVAEILTDIVGQIYNATVANW